MNFFFFLERYWVNLPLSRVVFEGCLLEDKYTKMMGSLCSDWSLRRDHIDYFIIWKKVFFFLVRCTFLDFANKLLPTLCAQRWCSVELSHCWLLSSPGSLSVVGVEWKVLGLCWVCPVFNPLLTSWPLIKQRRLVKYSPCASEYFSRPWPSFAILGGCGGWLVVGSWLGCGAPPSRPACLLSDGITQRCWSV